MNTRGWRLVFFGLNCTDHWNWENYGKYVMKGHRNGHFAQVSLPDSTGVCRVKEIRSLIWGLAEAVILAVHSFWTRVGLGSKITIYCWACN